MLFQLKEILFVFGTTAPHWARVA